MRKLTDDALQAEAVEAFKMMLAEGKTPPFALANIREELAGKNLACWCKIGTPCHADVLLRLANAELSEPGGPVASATGNRVAPPGFAPVTGSAAGRK